MNTYSNGFSYAVNPGRNEFILNFMQDHPKFDFDGKLLGTERELVAALVMPIEVAVDLSEAIAEMTSLSDE